MPLCADGAKLRDGTPEQRVEVYLALGSNLGKREENLRMALFYLAEQVELTGCSAIYETEPCGYAQQGMYLNLVCSARTDLLPRELLTFVKDVERRMGRTPTIRYGSSIIDVDILLSGQRVVEKPDLIIPHPRMTERAFVLVPLAELAPSALHPVTGQTADQLQQQLAADQGVRWWAPPPV